MSEFKEFDKITRFYEQDVIITEKIDGTNGLVWIDDGMSVIRAGSRSRWITPDDDNYGFAKWVEENKEDLKMLGPGYHYGEWWGLGIQRGYGMSKKVFSLFNCHRWSDESGLRPACCDVVPMLYNGPMTQDVVREMSPDSELFYSHAAQKYGIKYKNTEGVMMYFSKAKIYFKAPVKKGHKDE